MMSSLHLAAILAAGVAAQTDDLPVRLTLDSPRVERFQEEQPPQDPLQEPEPLEEEEGAPFVDFDWLEAGPRLGFAVFSEDYETDPSFSASFLARAPMPWLSPSSDPEGEYFGLFAEIGFTTVDRDIEPDLDEPDGVVLFVTVGVDYTVVRNETWLLLAQAGAGYIHYGGVTDLNDGIAPVVALTAGVNLSTGFTVTYSPEILFGNAGDTIFLNSVGLMIDF